MKKALAACFSDITLSVEGRYYTIIELLSADVTIHSGNY